MSIILNGKKLSEKIFENIKKEISDYSIKPKLAVVLVGDNPASQLYVKIKQKCAKNLGIESVDINFPKTVSENELLKTIDNLNNDSSVNAILVQLPLPDSLNTSKIINSINPKKDVDGFHPENIGRLVLNQEPYVTACTARGIIELLDEYNIDLSGKNVVVVGRSNIVGNPVARLFQNMDATVTVCHSKTKDISLHTRNADIVVCAVGKPKFLKADMIKQDAVVIDVGINKVEGKIVGDTDFDELIKKTSHITPVPKGVGPMTIAGLMQNTLDLYKSQNL